MPGWLRVTIVFIILCLVDITTFAATPSIARQWNELLLDAIRNDFARPTVHARNLWHVSMAMWDAWATYNPTAKTYLNHEKITVADRDSARAEAISYACYRILQERFASSPGAEQSLAAFDAKMDELGYDRDFTDSTDNSPAALGNRIAENILLFGSNDGANESENYQNQYYQPLNPPLLPKLPGNPDILDPNRWQPLALDFFVDQSGNVILDGFPEFLSAEWGQVKPFALSPDDLTVYQRGGFDYYVYHDPGSPPYLGTATADDYRWNFEMVSAWSSHLDPDDGVMWDISPGAIGNATLPAIDDYRNFYDFENGGDWGNGHSINPVTGQPYQPQIVPRGDYTRVLAEFWADGPDSETPPGHWFTIANYVSDHPLTVKRLSGSGLVLNDLEWDVKVYFMLGAAMHDAAVSAWGVKGWYDYLRPISAIRYLADQNDITQHPGLIELITAETSAPGERHAHLASYVGKMAVYAWRGPAYINNPVNETAGVGWILAERWWPYQRPSFVTPPFAGYVSGHSTFSRAAAVILSNFTGSEYFPGGLGEFHCPRNEFLLFEDGPGNDITLQWATYYDASDQTSLSRIWGGIHPPADDIPGRYIGQAVGEQTFNQALSYFGESEGRIKIFSSDFE